MTKSEAKEYYIKLREHWLINKAIGFRNWPIAGFTKFLHQYTLLNVEEDNLYEARERFQVMRSTFLSMHYKDASAKDLDRIQEVLYPKNSEEQDTPLGAQIQAWTALNPYWIGYEWTEDELRLLEILNERR